MKHTAISSVIAISATLASARGGVSAPTITTPEPPPSSSWEFRIEPYRHLTTDYQDGGFTYDADQAGLYTGLSIRF